MADLVLDDGHSVIIDPWGIVVGECSDGEGLCLAPVGQGRELLVAADEIGGGHHHRPQSRGLTPPNPSDLTA